MKFKKIIIPIIFIFTFLVILRSVLATPIIDVAKTYSVPKILEPNTKDTVFVAITNPYDYSISHVEITFDNDNNCINILSDTEWDLGTLLPHEYRFIPLRISISSCKNSIQLIHAEVEYDTPTGHEDIDEYLPLTITSVPKLEITNVQTFPNPVPSYSKVKLILTLRNNGTSELKNIHVVAVDTGCSVILSPNMKIISKLQPETSTNITYIIKTTNIPCQIPIVLTYTDWMGRIYNTTESIGVDVTPSLSIVSIKNLTKDVVAGITNHIKLEVLNEGDRSINNIIIKILANPNLLISFNPQEIFINKLNKFSYKTIEINVYADPNAEGVYKIPILVRYNIDSGNLINDSFVLTLRIHKKPNLLVYLDSTERNQVSIAIANVGNVEAKNVYVTLQNGKCYSVIGKSIEFIGDLDSGDYDTATYKVYPKCNSIELEGVVYYKDLLGNIYSQKFEIPVELYIENSTSNGSSMLYMFGFILIILAVLYYLYNRKKQNAL